MKKTIKIHPSFTDAGAHDAAYYRSLTPEQRIRILLELVRQGQADDAPEPRIKRVYRIVPLAES